MLRQALLATILIALTGVPACAPAVYLCDVVDGGQKPRELVYKTVNGLALKLHVFNPPGHRPIDSRPALVCIHGGGWTSGKPQFFFPHCRYFACRGLVTFSIAYRLASPDRNDMARCIADSRSALRYLRANVSRLGVDPQRIAVLGDSAGGHLAACLGLLDGFDDPADDPSVSARADAMLLYNPVLDLTTLGWTQGVPRATALSPLLHVEAGQPPALLTHGTEDKCVPVEQAHRFARAMQEAGNRCDLIVLDGIAHAFVLAGYTAPEEVVVHAIRAGDRFLASLGYLRGRPTLKRHPRRRVRTRLFDIP